MARLSENFVDIKCVFFLQNLSQTFLIIGRTERGIIINALRSLCKVPVILLGFNKT